jgi:hypothetical protein
MHSVRSDSLYSFARDPQFLWKTLWKTAHEHRVTPAFRSKSANCTTNGAFADPLTGDQEITSKKTKEEEKETDTFLLTF